MLLLLEPQALNACRDANIEQIDLQQAQCRDPSNEIESVFGKRASRPVDVVVNNNAEADVSMVRNDQPDNDIEGNVWTKQKVGGNSSSEGIGRKVVCLPNPGAFLRSRRDDKWSW